MRRVAERAVDAVFDLLMRPAVRRYRRWSFLVTLPLAYLIIRWRGLETGLAIVMLEFVVAITVFAVVLRLGGPRRAALLDLIAHPVARRVTVTEIRVLLTLPRALLRFRGRPPGGDLEFRYGRSSQELAIALALSPAIAAEVVAVHLLLPDTWGWIKIGLVGVSAYAYVWLLSAALGPRAYPHRIGAEEVEVRSGPFYRATVPLSSVRNIELRRESTPWRAGAWAEEEKVFIPVGGRIDLHLVLSAPVEVRRPFGEPISAMQLAVAADSPEEFARALEAAREVAAAAAEDEQCRQGSDDVQEESHDGRDDEVRSRHRAAAPATADRRGSTARGQVAGGCGPGEGLPRL